MMMPDTPRKASPRPNIANIRPPSPPERLLHGRTLCFTDHDSARRLLPEDLTVAASDQRQHVGHDAGKTEAPWICQVVRQPHRVELLLVGAQSLEVVDRLGVLVEEGS